MRYPALFFLLALALALTQFVDAPVARAVEPGVTFTVNSTGNGADDDPSDGACADISGFCTLAAAITQASQDPLQDVIEFNIDPLDLSNTCDETGICFITPVSSLPTVSKPAIIDGTTQPGYVDKPVIVIDGGPAGGASAALRITGGSSIVRGLSVIRTCCTLGLSHGIELSVNGDNIIEQNFIGIDWTGLVIDPTPANSNSGDEFGNRGSGIYINNSSNNTIGGTTPNERNIISGNFYEGVWIVGGSNNTVAGNVIGADIDGALDRGNRKNGVLVQDSANNTIGGTTGTTPGGSCAGACNLVAGNNDDGIEIKGAGSAGNVVAGNFIGTKASGMDDLRNSLNGVLISGAPNNTVGGTTAAARNLIAGNTLGDLRIEFAGATGNVVSGNFIGTTSTGAAKISNIGASKGVSISNAHANTIGGSTGTTPAAGCAGACNVISGHLSDGVDISSAGATGNVVQGNYIGVDALGVSAIPNGNPNCSSGSGIRVSGAPGNVIGGNDTGERNLISGNFLAGIELRTATADNTVVQGNYIGTNKTGNGGIGNCKYGIFIDGAENQQIGGVNPGEGNLISGNGPTFISGVGGIYINGTAAKNNLVRGNRIGTDATGQLALGNGSTGVYINSAPSNTIGGTNPGDRNVISGNGARGVEIVGPAAGGNKLLGNFIGLDMDGLEAVPNVANGVLISEAPNNVIGGLTSGSRNVISGNGAVGIDIVGTGATGNVMQGNYIGTGAAGDSGVGNGSHGIRISAGSGNFVGGTLPGSRNVISGNSESGVDIEGNSATDNQVRGNYIGVAADSTTPLGNGANGVHVAGGASFNSVGGAAGGAVQIIASNAADGIFVDQTAGTGNAASRNELRDNGQLGIDLGTPADIAPGVTLNDLGDADVNGGNELQNFPVVTLAESDNDATPGTHLTGTLNSKANATFTVDLYSSPTCDPSGYGEGEDHLGSVNVSTGGSGNGSFDVIFAGHTTIGWQITATATDSSGNTSEFSQCEPVVAGDVTPSHIQGDVNCQGGVNAVDALALLRHTAGLSVDQEPDCPAIGESLPPVWGDINCDGSINAVDALAILRHVTTLPVNQTEPCTPIGQPLS